VIDRTYPLGRVPDAICYLGQGHARGKIVLTGSGTARTRRPAQPPAYLNSLR